MHKLKYGSHSRDNFLGTTKLYDSTKKDLGENLFNQYAAVKQLCNSEKKLHKDMKYLEKYNKVIFKIAMKTSSYRYLRKIKNINSMKYDSTISIGLNMMILTFIDPMMVSYRESNQ